MSELFLQPSGGSLENVRPMKSVVRDGLIRTLDGYWRHEGPTLGVFYPVRFLASQYIDKKNEWPVVMHPGQIVSLIPVLDANSYSSANAAAGILASGEMYAGRGADDVAYKYSVNFLYDEECRGLITVCNGNSQTADSYTAEDGEYGIITTSGEVASTTSTPNSFTRTANHPFGIVNGRVYADLRYRYQGYEVNQKGLSVCIGGVLALPFIAIFGSGSTATVAAAVQSAVGSQLPFVIVTETTEAGALALLDPTHKTKLTSNAYGKFTSYSGSDNNEWFGTVIGRTNRPVKGLDQISDSLPGSGITGTDTGGLESRIYYFVKNVLAHSAVKGADYAATKSNLRNAFISSIETSTSDVWVLFGMVDVAFGTMKTL